MRLSNGILAGEMFVSRDLIGQLVLFHRSSITRSLRRPRSVLTNLILKVIRHRSLTGKDTFLLRIHLPGGIPYRRRGPKIFATYQLSHARREPSKRQSEGLSACVREHSTPCRVQCSRSESWSQYKFNLFRDMSDESYRGSVRRSNGRGRFC